MWFATPAWDLRLFRLLNDEWRHWLLDALAPLVSEQAFLWLLLVVVLVWLVRRGGAKAALVLIPLLLTVAMTDMSSQLLKKATGRLRPLNMLAGTHYVEDGEWSVRPGDFGPIKPRGTAYVSAHAANSMAVAVSVVMLWPRLGMWPLLLPLLVGWSRIYLGKHWPSDVGAGWLLGLGLALVVCGVWQWAAAVRRKQTH